MLTLRDQMNLAIQASDVPMPFGDDNEQSPDDAISVTDFQWTDYGMIQGRKLG